MSNGRGARPAAELFLRAVFSARFGRSPPFYPSNGPKPLRPFLSADGRKRRAAVKRAAKGVRSSPRGALYESSNGRRFDGKRTKLWRGAGVSRRGGRGALLGEGIGGNRSTPRAPAKPKVPTRPTRRALSSPPHLTLSVVPTFSFELLGAPQGPPRGGADEEAPLRLVGRRPSRCTGRSSGPVPSMRMMKKKGRGSVGSI